MSIFSGKNLHFAHASYPRKKITPRAMVLIYVLVGYIIAVTCLQLLFFDVFRKIIEAYTLLDRDSVKVCAALLIVSQVMGLPFLLRMKLSIAFRYFSVLSLALSAAWWCFLGVWGAGMTIGDRAFAGQGVFSGEVLLLFALCYLILMTAATYLLRDDVNTRK